MNLLRLLVLFCWGTAVSMSFAPSPILLTKLRSVRPASSESPSSLVTLHSTDEAALKDFSSETSGLFGNIRIPAALFAGASAGAAFAMPINMVSEGLRVGLVKRIYSLLLLGALSSEIVAVVISTLAVASLATNKAPKTESLSDFINFNYALPWTSARFHFLTGVLCFVMGLGLRAWVTIVCPIFGLAALGMISSATMLCIAFIQDMGTKEDLGSFIALPLKYNKLFFEKAKSSPLFAAAFGLYFLTFTYVVAKAPHICHYLAK